MTSIRFSTFCSRRGRSEGPAHSPSRPSAPRLSPRSFSGRPKTLVEASHRLIELPGFRAWRTLDPEGPRDGSGPLNHAVVHISLGGGVNQYLKRSPASAARHSSPAGSRIPLPRPLARPRRPPLALRRPSPTPLPHDARPKSWKLLWRPSANGRRRADREHDVGTHEKNRRRPRPGTPMANSRRR